MIADYFVARGVTFTVRVDDVLRVEAPEGLLTVAEWQELRARKFEIIDYLRRCELAGLAKIRYRIIDHEARAQD